MTKQIALLIAYNLICEEQDRFREEYSPEELELDPYYKELEEAKHVISHMEQRAGPQIDKKITFQNPLTFSSI